MFKWKNSSRRANPFLDRLRGYSLCPWCYRRLDFDKVVKHTEDGQLVCGDRAACDLARLRYLRREDRKLRGVSTTRVLIDYRFRP